MKQYIKIKNFLIALQNAMNVESFGPEADALERKSFSMFVDVVINTFIFGYCIFGCFCMYFFLTRAI